MSLWATSIGIHHKELLFLPINDDGNDGASDLKVIAKRNYPVFTY